MRRTTLISFGLVAFLGGLGLARIFEISPVVPIVGVAVLAVLGKTKLKTPILLTTMILFGIWRGNVVLIQAKRYDQLKDTQVSMQVTAREDGYYDKNGLITFEADDIVLDSGEKLIGQIEVAGRGVNAVYAGDVLNVQGNLYRKRGLTQAGISFAQIDLKSRGSSKIGTFRRNFSTGLFNVLPEQLASFGLGILIGSRNTLNESINEELIAVGLIHIVAVSGYNLTVIINQVKNRFGKSRFQTLVFSLLFIFGFLLMTAGEPSIVRAALVSSISLVFWYFGRTIKPLLILLLVAAITAGINPLYIWSSIGWYLSFAAFFGVLILSPALLNRFFVKQKDNSLLQLTVETSSAQLCTLPIILYIFGRLSLVSILSNVLTGMFIPLAMLSTFIAGIAGMIKLPLAGLLAVPARVIMEYILGVTSLLAKLPFANVDMKISWISLVILFIVILLLTLVFQKKVILQVNEPRKEII